MFYRVSPNNGVRLVWRGVVSNHQRHNKPPLFSGEPHPNGIDSLSTIAVTFEAETGAFTSSRHTSTTRLEAPEYKLGESSTTGGPK